MTTIRQAVADGAIGVAALVLIVAIGHERLGGIGLTGTALLMLLPVLWVSSRTDAMLGAAMALAAAIALNFFLLPPLYTFTIDGPTYIVIFVVFVAVALVTGGYAAGLRARQTEAALRAGESETEADFLAAMALASDRDDLDRRARGFLAERYGEARLFSRSDLEARSTGLSPLDASAAIWALDHDAVTGHASEVMPGADYRFLSFGRGSEEVLALPDMSLAGGQSAASLGRVAAHWGQARDRMTARAERRRREEAELRENTRRAMLAALGHDFRTPLTVLKEGLAQLPGAREAGLTAQVEQLRNFGENLLASARLDAGVPLHLEPVDLIDTFTGIERRVPVDESRVDLVLDVPSDVPLVRAEPVMLAHLLGNVIENAVRYAASRVSVACETTEQAVVLRIADDGPGVEPELAGRIFQPFVSARTEARGTGLGLAIASDLAAAMGARLTLEQPAEGKGAVFAVHLPIATLDGEAG